MHLEDGKTYRDGWHQRRTVMGATRDYPAWVWTLEGFWYVRATGQKVDYHRDTGHYVKDLDHSDTLITEQAS